MGREREASRAPPVRVVRGGLSLTAAARGPGPLSPAGLQSRFGNQGAQLVLGAVASRTAEPARPAPVAPTAAPVANDPGKPASAQPPPVAAAATPAGTAPAGPAPAAGAAPAAGPAPANDGGPAVAAAPPKAGAEAAPAAEAPAPSPADAVAPVAAQVRKRAGKARVHADADSAKNVAQAAGKNPATERSRAGALATVAAIDAIKPPVDSFRVKLIAALKEALPKEPKNADEAKRAQGQAKDSNQQISAALGTASEETTGTLEAASQPGSDVKAEGPDTPEVKLVPEVPGSSPAPVAAGPAVPESVPPPDLSGDRAETDRAMADAGVSKDQLAKSNEPEFNAVLQAREGAERAEAQRTEQFKAGEGGILAKQQGQTGAMLGQGLDSIHGARSDGLGLVGGKQTETQSKEAAERTRVTGLIEGIKNKTREAVLEILKLMETAATTAFAAGLGLAEKAYEDAFEENKGGIGNWLTNWGDDWEKLIEQSFKKGRSAYDRIVTETVNSVADIVETRLALAKARVQQGRKEVDDFVAGLTGESAKYGEEARTQIASEFEAMDGEIDSKRDEMVTALVDQYRESQKRVSALEEKLREANKSLWQRIKDATIGIIKKVIAFKNFLLDVLAGMAQVVSAIIDDPIGFLGNLIDGIMAGMEGFRSRIGQHLKKGLMEWLFGALEGAGIKIPETFDLKGIVGLVLQILGLTWDNIKARAIKVLGADTVAYLEKSWEIFQVLIKEGPGGLWRMLVEKIGDIKEMLLTQLGDFVKEKIIEAGIKWVLSLLNPVAAFIKACMAIYDIVKFFIDRAAQIASLINAILDTLGAIVKGNIAAMATSVENALARIIPVAIGFLASLLGLGGISDKIKAVIDKLRAPVNAAIDWIIGKAAGLVKKGFEAAKGLFKKKDKAPDAKAEEKRLDDRTMEQKQADVDRAVGEVDGMLKADGARVQVIQKLLPAIKTKYRVTILRIDNLTGQDGTEQAQVFAEINPKSSGPPRTLRELVAALGPINGTLAGYEVTIVSGPLKGTSVTYSSLGFPDFGPFAIKTEKIKMEGNRSYRVPDGDFGNANEKAGYARNGGEPTNCTWHHHEDRTTMQLVKTKVHDAFRHSGGVWVIKHLGKK